MKALVSLLFIFTVASLVWDAWLQMKLDYVETSAPAKPPAAQPASAPPSEVTVRKLQVVDKNGKVVITASGDKGEGKLLVAGNLQIVDENGKTVISASAIKGQGVLFVTGEIGGSGDETDGNQRGAFLSGDQLELAELTNDSNSPIPITIVENHSGKGRLHLLESGVDGTSFDAYAEGLRFNNSETTKKAYLNADSLTFGDPKNNTANILDALGIDLATFSGDATHSLTHIAALENNDGKGKLHLYDATLPGISLTAMSTKIFSFDSDKNVTNWEIPMTDSDDAFVDVNSKAYSTAKSSEGTFLIACEGVEPYLEGYKVHLEIGNPTTLKVNSPKLTVEWGAAFPVSSTDKDAVANWKKSLRQTTVTLGDSLRPGFWNDVDVVVSPAKADELAHFKVSIQTDSVSLTQPPVQH